jgi:hypothetical protein
MINNDFKKEDLEVLKLFEKELIESSLENIRKYESKYLISREKRNLKILETIIHENVSLSTISKRYDIDRDYVLRVCKLFILKARELVNL